MFFYFFSPSLNDLDEINTINDVDEGKKKWTIVSPLRNFCEMEKSNLFSYQN